ncbi:hypothetical protein EV128_103290 [Rhizobium azibense]|nr:hypothetical protein EV128_103290 [Rhizobium azibense]
MSFLYLVVMVAANTKYSINSLLSPAPDVTFLEVKNRAKGPLTAAIHHGCNTLIPRSNFEENRPR